MNRLSLLLLALLLCGSWMALAADGASLISEGESKLKAGEIDAAIALLRQAVDQDPGSTLAYTRLGGALVLKQEYDPAIEAFRKAIMLDGANADAFVGMSVAYLHAGDYALARAALVEAKRIDPSKQAEIDKLITYIDERDSGAAPVH